ncbi:MAG: hypothetical protein WC906_03715 [Parcubacteria group bacterium]|jgi:hypothetical protein
MKKIAIAVFAIGAVILVSGCAKKGAENNNLSSAKKETAQTEETSGGVINSIKDAIGLGKKMECSYTYKVGDESFTTKTFVEGKKYKGESEVMGKKQLMVFDGETMYTWSEDTKTGSKWNQLCMEELNKDNKPAEDSSIPKATEEDVKDASEAFKDAMDVKCTPVASIDFSVPSDITFSDMCEQLKKMQDMTKNLPKGTELPAGVSAPKGINPEDLKL